MYEIFENAEDNKNIYYRYKTLNNYRINNLSGKGYCWVFFTSHGLYFPTEFKEFEKQVIYNDKYEWLNLSKEKGILTRSTKHIYIRDIYKNWYLDGINATVNSIEKMAELILEAAQGDEIITVGSSAGGYMAIALGCLLNARYIYAFAPQISLVLYEKYHPIKYMNVYKDDTRSKWLSLEEMISNFTSGEIFYYYPTQCDEDVAQYNILKQIQNLNIHVFAVRFSKHGTPIFGESVKQTLSMPPDQLIVLCNKYNHEEIGRVRYLMDTSGVAKAGIVLFGSICRKFYRKLVNR